MILRAAQHVRSLAVYQAYAGRSQARTDELGKVYTVICKHPPL